MGTPTYPRRTIARVKKAVRDLHFVAYYQCSEEWVNDCMHDYADRAIVYILASKHEGQEYILYAGKTKTQYTRFIKHSSHYEYDTIYLFECAPELLDKCEAAVIKALCPLFNQHHNPEAERYRTLLGIHNEAEQRVKDIRRYLDRYVRYKKLGVYGFALPVELYAVLEKVAETRDCSCSVFVQQLLEKALQKETGTQLSKGEPPKEKTNMVSAREYGQIHGKSREQVKSYLIQQNRLPGIKIGRDWILPKDARFPEDMREASSRQD